MRFSVQLRLLFILVLLNSLVSAQEQGMYFSKKIDQKELIPDFTVVRSELPVPIYEQDSTFVESYWKTWELAFKNFHAPTAENGFVSNYIDAAFNSNIFLWDSGFLTMFCNYGHPFVPGISTLDNFYAKQHASGEICREINRTTGVDYKEWQNKENKPLFSRFGNSYLGKSWDVKYVGREIPKPNPTLTLEGLNHPILAWSELESFRITGDKERLKMVFEPLVYFYKAIQKYVQQGNGLYMTDWSSMDDSPRNKYIEGGGTAVDISSEMALFANNLSEIASMIERPIESKQYKKEAQNLAKRINELMWDEKSNFYYDLTVDGHFVPVKSISAFWPLLAQVSSKSQAAQLVRELENKQTFNRTHRVPTLAADQKDYNHEMYWTGGVWSPTNTMIIRGLEKYGYDSLANAIAMNHLENVTKVYLTTGTYWENYAADSIAKGKQSVKDFIGWTGIVPIMYLIEYAIGLKPDASKNELVWNISSSKRCGMKNLRFNGHTTSLIATPTDKGVAINIASDGEYRLKIRHKGKVRVEKIKSGEMTIFL
jgi:hypothetical protein